MRCTRGSILDVAVDIRRSSPTFGQHVSAVLSAENGQQLLVPKGFAHGYITLEADTEVLYKVTEYYSPQHDKGIAWDDAALALTGASGAVRPSCPAKTRCNRSWPTPRSCSIEAPAYVAPSTRPMSFGKETAVKS